MVFICYKFYICNLAKFCFNLFSFWLFKKEEFTLPCAIGHSEITYITYKHALQFDCYSDWIQNEQSHSKHEVWYLTDTYTSSYYVYISMIIANFVWWYKVSLQCIGRFNSHTRGSLRFDAIFGCPLFHVRRLHLKIIVSI